MDRIATAQLLQAAGRQQAAVSKRQRFHHHGGGRLRNSRKDYHHDPSDEFFYQVEGDMVLKTVQDGRMVDVPIRAGEMYLLPAEVPHSPQRPAGSVGIVVERRRGPDELDGFSWYCENCGHQLYSERVAVANIETQLPQIFSRFYASLQRRTCSVCGTTRRRHLPDQTAPATHADAAALDSA